jgi:hypothetical protein
MMHDGFPHVEGFAAAGAPGERIQALLKWIAEGEWLASTSL